MARQRKLTDKELGAALAEIAAEQAAWFAARWANQQWKNEAARLALCRWIGNNCYNHPVSRPARGLPLLA